MPNIFDYNPANITPYPYWRWNKVLPAIYDDSLSQYEILSKLLYTVNEIISSENDMGTQVEQLTQLVQQLIDGEFPSGLVDYVEDIAEAAVEDDIAAINAVIESMQQEIETLQSYVNPEDYLVFIGDSYLRGTGSTEGPTGGEGYNSLGNGWGRYLASVEGVPASKVMCIGGGSGGFTHLGTNGGGLGLNFAGMITKAAGLMSEEEISRIRYVAILGGANDGSDIVMSDIDTALTLARQLFPNKPIHVFTNLSTRDTAKHNLSEGNANAYHMIKRRCSYQRASFHEIWQLGLGSTSIYASDNIHCNSNGYLYLARSMYAAIHSGIVAPMQIGEQGYFDITPATGVTVNAIKPYYDGNDYVQINSAVLTVDVSTLPINGASPVTIATIPAILAPRFTMQSFALSYGSAFWATGSFGLMPVDLTDGGAIRVRRPYCTDTSGTGAVNDLLYAHFPLSGTATPTNVLIQLPSFVYKIY